MLMYSEQAKEILMFLDLSLTMSCHAMVKQNGYREYLPTAVRIKLFD